MSTIYKQSNINFQLPEIYDGYNLYIYINYNLYIKFLISLWRTAYWNLI